MRIVMMGSVLAASVLLAGCASTQKVLAKPVAEVWHSDQSAKEVAFCLANKNSAPAMERDDGSRVVLVKNGYGGVAIALTVKPDGTGSTIEVRRAFTVIHPGFNSCLGTKVAMVGQ